MRALILALQLFFVTKTIASPFDLTDRYIQEFEQGIENLKKQSETYKFEEGHFDPTQYNETIALQDAEEYDFIIVGAGASGSVIANRLSEVPEWKILLLEAGEAETPYTQVPGMAKYLHNSPYNWGYKTEKQESWCLGMVDQKCVVETGKALGGSTAINSMLYTRGNAKDYDLWADHGNDGWCYKDVLPFFKKSENAHLHEFDHNYHSLGGPVNVEDPQHETYLADKFIEAAKELDLKVVDYNGKTQLGVSKPQVSTKHGKRNSAAQAYLVPAHKRKNLIIKPSSHVIKIIITPHTKETYGVKYIHDGKLYIAKSTKEVILSAGAINTAQLLLLSGIGPKEDLEKLEIHPVHDLKVGQNLKDHAAFIGLMYTLNETLTPKQEQLSKHETLTEYLRNGKGPLTGISVAGLAYIRTEASKDKTEYPDVELLLSPKASKPNLPFTEDTVHSLWKPIEGKQGFTIVVMQAHPKSTGYIQLKSKDPFHHPIININQLSDPDDHDITTMLKGVRKGIEIGHSKVFQELGAHINEHQVHGCDQHEFNTDEYWKCAIRHLTVSLRHPSGTAKMGPETDKDAVVDKELKVHGVHKLRVADASIIPVSITGHLHAPVVMIGEKAAHLIKQHWK